MGLIVLDAGVVIAVLDANDSHHQAATAALTRALATGSQLLLPASAYAEALVGPFEHGERAVDKVDEFLAAVPIDVQPIDRDVARAAAELRTRGQTRLRLPDALVVATAIAVHADELLTTDRRWPVLPLPITVV